jgi:hypothetical protein
VPSRCAGAPLPRLIGGCHSPWGDPTAACRSSSTPEVGSSFAAQVARALPSGSTPSLNDSIVPLQLVELAIVTTCPHDRPAGLDNACTASRAPPVTHAAVAGPSDPIATCRELIYLLRRSVTARRLAPPAGLKAACTSRGQHPSQTAIASPRASAVTSGQPSSPPRAIVTGRRQDHLPVGTRTAPVPVVAMAVDGGTCPDRHRVAVTVERQASART